MFIGLYVDDLILGAMDLERLTSVKEALSNEFRMKDLGEATYILGMKIERTKNSIFLSQEHYARGILKRFGMAECNGVNTPMLSGTVLEFNNLELEKSRGVHENVPYREAVGSLMYLMTCTRPDLATSVSMVSSYLEAPRVHHWATVKRIFRYVSKTINYGVLFNRKEDWTIAGYSDADWAGDLATRKSRTGYIFLFGGGSVSWQSRLQDIVTLSTAEAEYVAATEAGKESVWIRQLFHQLGELDIKAQLFVDNQSAIKLAKNPVFHRRTKHIDVKYHKIREWVGGNYFDLQHVSSSDMVADFLTKNVNSKCLERNRRMASIVEAPKVITI
jgi:hypothetical protein